MLFLFGTVATLVTADAALLKSIIDVVWCSNHTPDQ